MWGRFFQNGRQNPIKNPIFSIIGKYTPKLNKEGVYTHVVRAKEYDKAGFVIIGVI